MRVMSDAAEQRVCEEDFGSEEGEEADVESYLEDNSSELMDRLRELEAENSALMLANESQREAYERCLDEVANHVVQALLNQKDLREECIKLKMLVYDLERQNRALCELFQQKLPNHPTTHYQVQTGPLPDLSPQQQSSSKQESAPMESQAKGNGYRSQHASPARGPPTSMEALSPFFKKKAHILEVLRKMEETDPLKFHPSAPGLPFCDYSQVLMSTEAVLASADPLSLQHKPLHPHCRCPPRPDPSPAQDQCCPHARSPDAPPKPCGHLCNANANANASAKTGAQSQGGAAAAGGASEGGAKGRAERGERGDGKQQSGKSELQQLQTTGGAAGVQQATTTGEERTQLGQDPDRGASCSDDLTGFPPSLHLNESAHSSNFDPETSEDVNIPERDSGGDPEAPLVRAGASVSPSPSCLSDVKSAAINSPSKLLKFLKIPSITEKSQANPNSSAVRLSPQLTRNSRIPCRTNNYEVYHSPVPTRRATTTERCRQPPPPPSRSESYPATHSAPTSPPQSEDVLPEKDYASSKASQAKTSAPSSSATPSNAAATSSSSSSAAATSSKVTQPVPHYENVAELKASQDNDDFEKRLQAKTNAGERKLVKSLPESVLNERKQSSSSTTESTSDEEEDSDSPVWVNHHNVPVCQPAVNKTQATKEVSVGLIPIPVVVGVQPPAPARRTESSSIPKRPGMGAVRPQGDPSHHAFKERLAALGKLRSSDDLQVGLRQVQSASGGDLEEKSNRTVDRQLMEMQKEDLRFLKYAETTEGKPKVSERKYSTQMFEQGAKAQQLSAGKQEAGKSDVSKSKIGLPSPITDAPQVLRNNIKCPGSLNLAYNVKPQSTNSPNKIPPKSPSKPCPASAQRVSKPPDAPRYSSKSEERAKMGGKAKKTPMFGDSLPPPPPKPPVTPDSQAEKIPIPIPTQPAATSPQSAIEQKVMKGIEENMLKELKEQDKVGQVTEVKQKASNGIASWFGLKKSKLPALSRKTDPAKGKDEKREWKINIPSVGRDSVKVASRCKEGVEGLNISTLMEKAEGLRRALEEERQFVERQGRGHSCEVVMDQSQGQLAVMYRGGRGDNFMQQLLNRVDGKEVICLPQRRLSFDCKTSKPVFHTDILSHTTSRDDMEKAAERIANVTSDENLADSVQHFAAGSGASTYTLDSGIGTFPLPECSSGPVGRGLSKARVENHHASSGSPGRAGRRSRTLEREMPSGEEVYNPHRQLIPTLQYSNIQETRGTGLIREDKEGASMFSPRTKTWTFPNLKAPAGPAEVYLAVEEEEEPLPYSAPYRASVKASVPPSSSSRGVVDQGSLPVPPQAGLGRRGKSRAPSVPEMSRADPALDPLSPSRPQALETPESLSDSLYDSLSSCGSQG